MLKVISLIGLCLFVVMAKDHSVFNEFATITHNEEPMMSRILKQLFHKNIIKSSKQGRSCFFCDNSFDISPKKRFNEIANTIFGNNQKKISDIMQSPSFYPKKSQNTTKPLLVYTTKNNATVQESSLLIGIESMNNTTLENQDPQISYSSPNLFLNLTSSNQIQTKNRVDKVNLPTIKTRDSTSFISKSPIVSTKIENPFLRSKPYLKSTNPIITTSELSFIPLQSTTPLIRHQSYWKQTTQTKNPIFLTKSTSTSFYSSEPRQTNSLDEIFSHPNCKCIC